MKRRSLLQLISALLVTVILAAPTAAMASQPGKEKGKGKPAKAQKHKQGKSRESSDNVAGLLVSVAIDFAQARRLAVANNYTGYAALPPGIRKNLARGKPMPPGIAKKAVPGPMLRDLPAYPGYEWQISGSDLVLVAVATLIVAEVLEGVFD